VPTVAQSVRAGPAAGARCVGLVARATVLRHVVLCCTTTRIASPAARAAPLRRAGLGGRTYAPTISFAGGLRRLARTAIIHLSFKELARAVTIAVQYSAVRRQVLTYGEGLRGAEIGESTHDRGLRLAGV
jgi:hypothetical protein